jgi:DNA-binding MarR family transcriptional regulator
MTPKQPLAVTPSPAKGEALLGFILKTSALNGYTSPSKLFGYAGMADNEARSARPPLNKLAPLFGKTTEELVAAGLDYVGEATPAKHLPLMGHNIPFMYTRSKNAGFCLQCVQEHGFISGLHELKYALACPQHHCKTVLTCPSCHSPLNWHRRNLTTCSCGANLSASPPRKVEHPAVLVLLGVLHAKLMRESLNQDSMKELGFPVEAIEQLSIQTLLSMIYRFGLFNQKQQPADNELEADWQALQTTAEVLSNWPNKFHDYLEAVHAPTANLKVSGLRGQFNSFYESFFKNIEQEEELQFMRDAFVKFGQERWRQASVHPKLVNGSPDNSQAPYGMGMQQLATKIGVHPGTVRKLIAKGLVQVTSSELNKTRKLIELSPQQQFSFAEGKSLSIKKAAEILDIPVAILRVYRARGYYQAKYLAIPIELFHERDVESLQQDLMQNCKQCKVFVDKRHITMALVMRMKISSDAKATFIVDVKNRVITPLGKLSEKPSGLIFDLFTTKKHLSDIKQRLLGGISFEAAKEALHVDKKTLLSLVRTDVLQYQYTDLILRVVENSLDDFNNQYISCAQIAQMKLLTVKAVIKLCEELKIKQFQISQTDFFKPMMVWIEKTQLPLLGIAVENEIKYSKAA